MGEGGKGEGEGGEGGRRSEGIIVAINYKNPLKFLSYIILPGKMNSFFVGTEFPLY